MMKVLIVEDDKNTLLMLRLLLSHAGCRVSSADNPPEGLVALENGRFDWMIVDGQMLPIDGFELAAKAKKMQPDIKIIMISGIYGPEDIAGHPIRKLFQKPVDTDALVSYLRASDSFNPTV